MAFWIKKYRAIMDGSAQPWEVERTWQNGRITPISSSPIVGVIFGLIWLAAVGAMVSVVVIGTEEPLGYFAAVMVGPGIYILVRSLRRLLNERKYRNVHLRPSGIPVAPGARFEATVYSGADAAQHRVSDVQFQIRITANKWVERSTTSDRSGPRKRRYVVWETTIPVAAASGTTEAGSALIGRFGVDLPDGLEETSRLPASVTYDWRLEVDATDSLPGFRYEFRLPVFDTRTALEKADTALGTVTEADLSADAGDVSPATGLNAPVEKADLDGLRAYQNSIQDERLSLDGRSAVQRLFLALKPHTHLDRSADQAVSVIHVKGDPTVRQIRRISSAVCLVLMFFIPGAPTLLFFVAAVILFGMGKAAQPAALALHADESGLQIDEVRGRKARSSQYPWSSVGMISDTRFSSFYYDVFIPRPKIRVPTIGARIPSQREAEGIAAAISSVKDRYR